MLELTRRDHWQITSQRQYNLQIQANKNAPITSVRKIAPKTVAGPVLIGQAEVVTAAEVRRRLHAAVLI